MKGASTLEVGVFFVFRLEGLFRPKSSPFQAAPQCVPTYTGLSNLLIEAMVFLRERKFESRKTKTRKHVENRQNVQFLHGCSNTDNSLLKWKTKVPVEARSLR